MIEMDTFEIRKNSFQLGYPLDCDDALSAAIICIELQRIINMEYSEKQLKIITDACASIFALVSLSDGSISKKEEETFLNTQIQSIKDSKILNETQDEVILEFLIEHDKDPNYLRTLSSLPEETHVERILKSVRLVYKKENETDFNSYCRQMNNLARNIASSSRGFFGFGNAISQAENATLKKINILLRVPKAKPKAKPTT